MENHVQKHLAWIEAREHHKLRRQLTGEEEAAVVAEIRDRSKSYIERTTRRLELFLQMETPVWMENTRIQGLRTLIEFPAIYADGEMDEIKKTHFVHEKGKVCNLACDYGTVLSEGLEGRRARLRRGLEMATEKQREYAAYVERNLDAAEGFADLYAALFEAHGQPERGGALRRSIRTGARTLEEAMQCFRMIHFGLWAADHYHNTVGRFDQYMVPFYQADLAAGRLDEDSALTLIEDFFLSFNVDSDLYYSLQWGDNGQSLMLGGCAPGGCDGVNELTYLALRASRAIRQIDPKLNLRVDHNTPLELYELATELTRLGMGFPQYANDDVVIPGLERLGYRPEDARNYTVAACWEFIVPCVAMDIPNIGAVPLTSLVSETIREGLKDAPDFEALMNEFETRLRGRVRAMASALSPLFLEPAPYQSFLMSDCMENKRDISEGARYNNYGFHGTGFSGAVDQLAAVRDMVFQRHAVTAEELLAALDANFEGYEPLRHELRTKAPKIGRDESARLLGDRVLRLFSDSLVGLVNERGGCFRAGTGSAMYYLWHAKGLPATADGRDANQPLSANFSPALFLQGSGPLSVLHGFALPSLPRAINGGPMTLELHDTVFGAPDSVEKVARLVQSYILQGGHQLQLNAVNRDKMLRAQVEPEKYPDLIVRVWGWSGHFVELDRPYQEQILARTEFGMG